MYRKPIALRGFALFIDSLLIGFIGIVLNKLFGFGTLTNENLGFNFNMNWWEATILAVFYFSIIEYFWKGKTPGKAVFGLEVRYDNLKPITNNNLYLYRGALKGLLLIGTILSWIIMLVSVEKKTLHDLVLKTVVVKKMNQSEVFEEPKQL